MIKKREVFVTLLMVISIIVFSSITVLSENNPPVFNNFSNNSDELNIIDNLTINVTDNSSYELLEVYNTIGGEIKNESNEEIVNTSILNNVILNESLTNQISVNSNNNTNLKYSKKIHNSLINSSKNKKIPVIIQLEKGNKEKIKSKIKKGDIKQSYDSTLVMANLEFNEIVDIANTSFVTKIWPDLQTKAFLSESVYQIGADYLWNLSLNGSGIKIAILDTGIDTSHEMFNGKTIISEDFTGTGAEDVYGHGTHVAGITGGYGQYKGVGFGATIFNGKVLDDSGSGQLSWLINGIDWAIQNNVDIISLSLGAIYSGSPEDQLLSPEVLKVQEAIDNGIIVVIASGNCGSGRCGSFDSVTTPGIAKNAITVGAVDKSNNCADFSSGDYIADYIKPDLVAPGVDICSSVPNGYDCYSGTSMATPHVSGSVALLLEDDSSLTPNQVKSVLASNSIDLGDAGKDIKYGSGLLNLNNILNINPVPDADENNEHYKLIIPVFEIGETNSINLEYFSQENCSEKTKGQCKPNKITVTFDLEELDKKIHNNITKTIPFGKSKEFKMKWTPMIIGKHLLKINIFNESNLLEHIEVGVDVSGKVTREMDEVMLLIKN